MNRMLVLNFITIGGNQMSEKIVRYNWEVVKEVKACLVTSKINERGKILRRRYRLDVTLNRGCEHKIALFIMMNPSKADSEVSDDTIKKIITYVNKIADETETLSDIGKIIFVNLYVVYETLPRNVNALINLHGKEFVKGTEVGAIIDNNTIIMEAIKLAYIKIAAWGEADILGYPERITEVKEFLQGEEVFCIGKPTQKGFPRHLSRIDYEWDIERFDIV